MKYSIVIPLYNEEESIPELYERIKAVMDQVAPKDYEIIFINDGSTDNSLEIIKKIQKTDPSIQVISFRKNMGKAAGLSVGFDHVKGKYVITMDADLQDEPTEIPKMIKKLSEGYDLVSGWKEDRQDPIDKTLPSKVFNFLVSKLSGVNFHDFNCGFKLYKRQVLKEIEIYGQLYRFIPVLAYERGFKVTEMKVKHNKRKYGKSKYNWKRIFAGIMDLMTVMFLVRYGKRPLHLFGFVGGLATLMGIISLGYLTIVKVFFGQHIADRPLLIFGGVLLIAGLQLIFTGLIAEMLTKYNHQNTQYPFVIEEE